MPVLGFTFKEIYPDVRNTRVIDIVKRLEEYHVNVSIHAPWANPKEVSHGYKMKCNNGEIKDTRFDAIILAVAHEQFRSINISQFKKPLLVIYDVKVVMDKIFVDSRL
jgi:UDP-N-acetyl-D-galactosamine dehydrogenase